MYMHRQRTKTCNVVDDPSIVVSIEFGIFNFFLN